MNEHFDDESGAITVDARTVDTSSGEERKSWIAATMDEMSSVDEKKVKEYLTDMAFREKYGGRKVKKLSSKVVRRKSLSMTEKEAGSRRFGFAYAEMEKKGPLVIRMKTEQRYLRLTR